MAAGGILASGVAPAIVRADSLMRIVPLETELLSPSLEIFIDQTRRPIEEKALVHMAEWWARRMDEVFYRVLTEG